MSSEVKEHPVVFDCNGHRLLGVHCRPKLRTGIGILIVVGGPQYRVGSHRQFVLLARRLAEAGIPVLRFDFRGMGDSEGEPPGFEALSPDIKAAIDTFYDVQPDLAGVVIWGLCDAASAAMLYGFRDGRVSSMIMLNPWVRSENGQAKTLLKHYYVGHVLSFAFWRKLISGNVGLRNSLKNLIGNVKRAFSRHAADSGGGRGFVKRMLDGLEAFSGRTLIVISGNDLTAAEFMDLVDSEARWRRLLRRPTCRIVRIDDADHTFSSSDRRHTVEQLTIDWVLHE